MWLKRAHDVQKLLGHKSIIMTQVYAHLSENATRRAVDLLIFKHARELKVEFKNI